METKNDQGSTSAEKELEVLYVDDLPNRDIIDRFEILYGDKMNVRVVYSLTSAIKSFEETTPDLIVCDGSLTDGETGIDFYDHVKGSFTGHFILHSANESILNHAEGLGIPIVNKCRSLRLFDLIDEMKLL